MIFDGSPSNSILENPGAIVNWNAQQFIDYDGRNVWWWWWWWWRRNRKRNNIPLWGTTTSISFKLLAKTLLIILVYVGRRDGPGERIQIIERSGEFNEFFLCMEQKWANEWQNKNGHHFTIHISIPFAAMHTFACRRGADEVESHALWLQQNSSFLIRPCSSFLFIFPFAFAEEYCICRSKMWNVKSSSGLLHLLECAWASIHWSMKAATFISSITSAQIHSFFCWCVGYAIFIIVRTCSWIILSHTFPSLLLLFNEHFQINLLNKLLLKKNRFCVATMKLLWMVSDEMS